MAALAVKIVSYNTRHPLAPPTRSGESIPMKKNTPKTPPAKAAPPSKTTSSSKATPPPQTKQVAKTMADRLRDVPEFRRDESDNSD